MELRLQHSAKQVMLPRSGRPLWPRIATDAQQAQPSRLRLTFKGSLACSHSLLCHHFLNCRHYQNCRRYLTCRHSLTCHHSLTCQEALLCQEALPCRRSRTSPRSLTPRAIPATSAAPRASRTPAAHHGPPPRLLLAALPFQAGNSDTTRARSRLASSSPGTHTFSVARKEERGSGFSAFFEVLGTLVTTSPQQRASAEQSRSESDSVDSKRAHLSTSTAKTRRR